MTALARLVPRRAGGALAALAAAALLLDGAMLPAPPAAAGQGAVGLSAAPAPRHLVVPPVPAAAFGLHPIAATPALAYGSARLWDSGTRWAELAPTPGRFRWGALDERVRSLRSAGIRDLLYVFGSTPRWAAASFSSVDLYGPGTSSPPRRIADFERYVRAVATRFKGRITAYQVWNEANLTSFWRGTPEQMADLTARVHRIVAQVDPQARVVAASTTTRLTSAYRAFFPRYLAALKARGWPVDAVSAHLYPASTGGPNQRRALIAMVQSDLAGAGAGWLPLWDTEVNYGLKGPGPAYPDRDIGGGQAPAWVARTYLDSLRMGVARTYWYAWGPPRDLLGITLAPRTRAAAAYGRVFSWAVGASFSGCRARNGLVTCGFARSGAAAAVVWSDGRPRTVMVPAGMRWACPASGPCRAVAAGSTIAVGGMPLRLSAAR